MKEDATTSSPHEAPKAAEFSAGRVTLALAAICTLAAAGWFLPDVIAHRRAASLYNAIAAIQTPQGETAYSSIRYVTGVDPSITMKINDGQYELKYVFEGLHKRFTVRVVCWAYVDDPEWYLFSTELFSERKF